jgi:integrase
MAQRKIRNSWWVDITYNRKRYRKKSPEDSKTGAQRYEMTLRRELSLGNSIEEEPKDRSQPFKEFAEFWFKTHVLVHNKPSMAVKTRGILNRLLIPTFGERPLNAITTLEIERYKSKRAGSGVVNKTINSELGILGKCLRDAKRWLGIERIPDIVVLKLPPSQFDFLSKAECNQLLSHLSDIWYDIAYTALKTGLRRGELQALRWRDVQLQNKTLTVQHSRCTVTGELLAPKGNKIRSVPLSDDVFELFLKRFSNSEFVFEIDGDVFNGNRFNRNLQKACAKAGIRPVTCHVLRHSYASHLAMAGVPIIVVQRLLGHTDIKVTMRYAHLSQESVHAAVQVMQKPFAGPLREAA